MNNFVPYSLQCGLVWFPAVGIAAVRDSNDEDAVTGLRCSKLWRWSRRTDWVYPAVGHTVAEGSTCTQMLLRLRILPWADWIQETNLWVHAGTAYWVIYQSYNFESLITPFNFIMFSTISIPYGITAKQIVMIWAFVAKRRQWLSGDNYGVWSGGFQSKI